MARGGFLSEHGFILTEETEERTADGEAVLVQLLADDAATDDLVFDGFAVIHGDLHHRLGVLACIVEGHGIGAVREDKWLSVAISLDIYLCAYGQISLQIPPCRFVTGYGLNETVFGDDLAVSGGDILRASQAET